MPRSAVYNPALPNGKMIPISKAVPNSLTPEVVDDLWLMNAVIANNTAGAITILMQDGEGTVFLPTLSVPANGTVSINGAVPFYGGITWQAGGVGLSAKLSYQKMTQVP